MPCDATSASGNFASNPHRFRSSKRRTAQTGTGRGCSSARMARVAANRSKGAIRAGRFVMPDDEQAIRRLIATWISATNAGDTDKVLALMADDVTFLIPGQPPKRG